MATYRYWRLPNLRGTVGGAAHLSECQLFLSNVRVDASATLTCDQTPLTGTISALTDDNVNTLCLLPEGASLTWDFGVPAEVDSVLLGSGDTYEDFPQWAELFGSTDGVVWESTRAGLNCTPAWPGPRTKQLLVPAGVWTTASKYTIDPSNARVAYTSVSGSGSYVSSSLLNSSGIKQFEVKTTGDLQALVGLNTSQYLNGYIPGNPSGVGILLATGEKYIQGLSTYADPFQSGDVLGVVQDFNAGTITCYRNGASLGVARSSAAAGSYGISIYENMGGVRTHELRTSDFWYPIAGADPWNDDFSPRYGFGPASEPYPQAWVASPYGGYPDLDPSARLDPQPGVRPNYLFDPKARGRIVGTVKRKDTPANVPLSRRVRLFRDSDGALIRETWSNAQGVYQFDYLEEWEAYTAISYDHTRSFRAAAADNLTLANGGITLIP